MTAQTPAPPPPSRLDDAALARLRELDPDGRHGVVVRVLTAFEGSLQRMLQQLQAPGVDAGTVAAIAHTLKSSAASVGALALARAGADAEQAVRSGPDGEFAAHVQRLVHEGRAALAAVEAMLRPQDRPA